MLSKEEYIALYEKYLSGECTDEEICQLMAYDDNFLFSEGVWDEKAMGRPGNIKARIYNRLRKRIHLDPEVEVKKETIYGARRWTTYAAAALILFIGSLYWLSVEKMPKPLEEDRQSVSIVPGGDKAVLVLEDGTEVFLDDLHLGDVAIDGKILAEKAEEGELRYGGFPEREVRYHTIRTPRGGQYRVTLTDGTKVWLNAASSIRFPTAFRGQERYVEIEGEVFFDVQRDTGKPFVVKSDMQQITVLGTQFSVMAYPDEEGIKTSLIEGSVAIDIAGSQYILKAAERSVYDRESKKVSKETFDPEEILAWQEGYFMFNEESIEHVMRKIARWYDLEVEYRGNMKGKLFSGTVSRFAEVGDVLDMLELTGTVTFKIEGRRILVMG